MLHEALKRRSYWRPAIDALKASLTLVDDAQVRETYDALVAEHGFRIVEYKVDADSAQPRLCIQFSERLASGQVDWSQYFMMDGKDPQSVTAEARQICLDGLAHGRRYEVQVREGLPSAVGEKLAKTAELAVYVKDRAPSVRASGRGYVLPNRGQQGIPLVTVNTDKVSVEVYRIGDRSLAQTLQSGDFAKQISSYDITALKERTGAQVYAGELTVATRLNEDVTTAFPIAEAIPKLQPGVYVLAAYASTKKEDDSYRNAATQWFVVSDLGLTAINGDDGMHTFVRSLAAATPVVNANVRLIARNNEVLATVKTDSRGYARFDAGLKSGEGGLAPAVLVAETGDGDYAFLDLSTGAFDLTDRGVKGRNRARPDRRLRLYRSRRLPRRRAGAPGRPGARPHRQGVGRSHHRHLLAPRRRRALARDAHRPGPGRARDDAGAGRLGHDRHLARQDPHRSQVRRHRPGLLPGRGLRAGAPRPQARAGRAGAVPAGARHHQARRPLSLRAPRHRPRRRGRDRREARQGRSAGLRRLQVRPRRRAGGTRAQAARRACPPPTRKARPTSPCCCRRCRRPAGRWKPT